MSITPAPPAPPTVPWWRQSLPTLRYWMETEVHVYAFSIAANVLLSFFPFLIVMVALCRYVLHVPGAEQAIYLALDDYFPGELGNFLTRNLVATVGRRGAIQAGSILLLLFTANGIFEPLEVALNRAWGGVKNRSFVKNQMVSMALIFAVGTLALISTLFTAFHTGMVGKLMGTESRAAAWIGVFFFKAAAIPATVFGLFLVYWLLPNRKVPWRTVVAPAVAVGLALEGMKYFALLIWPWLSAKLYAEYGPFRYSAAILLFSFLAAMLVLGGAEWAARGAVAERPAEA